MKLPNHAQMTRSHPFPKFIAYLSVKNDPFPTRSRILGHSQTDPFPPVPENHAQFDPFPPVPKVGNGSNTKFPMTSSHFPLSIEGKWERVGAL